MTYEEKLQHFIIDGELQNDFLSNHLIIFGIEKGDRRKLFLDYVTKAGLRKYHSDIHKAGDDDYDYVLCNNETFTPTTLYELLKNHSNKILVFDTNTVLNKKGLLNIIEGGVCSSPDSSSKWPVRFDNKPEFYFNGNIIILTGYITEDFAIKSKFRYLIRDCLTM